MKIKEIVLTVCSLIGCFTACTNEEAINPVVTDGTISVSFSIDGILTKATNEPGSTAEYTVNKSTVALFDYVDGVPTNCIGFSDASATKTSENSYTVSGIDVKSVMGKPVYVLVIANSNNTYTNAMTYQQYMADIVKTETFAPESLVKVGGKQHTFTAAAESRTVNVELTQLPARVDVKFAFPNEASGHSCTFDVTSYKIEKVNMWSQLILPDYPATGYTHNTAALEVDLSWTKAESSESGISAFSFYTYEKATTSNPVVLTITGQLFDGTSTEEKTYTLNLNPTTSNGGETNGLIHGHLYDVTGNIDISSKRVTFNVTVKEWQQLNVGAEIKDVHYLFVKEHLAYMSNVGYYEIEFASDLPANKLNVKARYPYYKKSGNVIQSDTASYSSNDREFPTIVVDNDNKLIKITSPIPTNYFSKTITFDVTNTAGLTESVKIIQYPALYMEGEVSKGGDRSYLPGSSSPSENPNLFTVTTVAADGYKVGVHKNANGTTMDDAESNQLVSPKFIVSSRYAVVSAGKYTRSNAIERCKTYWETTDASKTGANATYRTGKWRLPTVKELQLLYQIQSDGLLAGTLFYTDNSNSAYWSAQKSWYVKFYNGQAYDHGSDNKVISGSGGIRCVYDVY